MATSGGTGLDGDPAGSGGTARGDSSNGVGGSVGVGGMAAIAGSGGRAIGGAPNAAGAGGTGGAATPCSPGTVRCETVREHCDDSGAWVKESFVCATEITGSIEQATVCAVKSDGRMTCFGQTWDMNAPALVAHAPQRKWSKVTLSDDFLTDHDLCGIDDHGNGVCWGIAPSERSVGGPLVQIAPGSQGLCVISLDGALNCPSDDGIVGPIAADAGPFQDLVLRNGFLFGLTRSGSVIVPFPRFALPSGVYSQISASDRELCAVRLDHELFCAPNALPPALAAERFLGVTVGYYGDVCAIREDHSVICDPLGQGLGVSSPPGEFTRFVLVSSAMCGIRTDGSIACFGPNSPELQPYW